MLKWKIFRSKWLAIIYFIFISVLFFLPGTSFPERDWMMTIDFDKFVHFCIFSGLVFLWRSAFDLKLPKFSTVIFLGALLYGFLVEVIQLNWIPNRSFDLLDVVADSLGSLAGLLVWARVHKKNKPL
jgi:VanZ family protein